MNRHSVAKYMDMLVISGHVEMKSFGSSKVFYLTRRPPMSAILNFSSDFIIVLNKDLEIINVNDGFLAFENIKKQDVLNKSIINSSFPMEFNPSIIPSIKEALGGNESTIEAYLKKGEGSYYFTAKLVPTVFDDTEKGVIIIFEDITARKQAEAALKESEERFRIMVENIDDGMWELDKNFVFTYISPRVYDILEYLPEEVVGKTPFDLMPPGERERAREAGRRMLDADGTFKLLECELAHKDGRRVFVEITGTPILDANGVLQGYRGVTRDVTKRKRAL